MPSTEHLRYDRRLIRRNIRDGRLTDDELQKHIKDLEDGSPDKPDSHDKLCGEFVRRYRKAMAKHNIDRTDALHRRGNRQWYRELAILERRDRRTWGRYEPKGGSDEAFDPDDRFL